MWKGKWGRDDVALKMMKSVLSSNETSVKVRLMTFVDIKYLDFLFSPLN